MATVDLYGNPIPAGEYWDIGVAAFYAGVFWPESLPQKVLQANYQDSEPDMVLKTQMDAGPPKLRKRFSANIREFSGNMYLTLAQKTALTDFYNSYCSSQFMFPHPESGETVAVIFTAAPTYGSVHGLYQLVSLKLGIMP